MYHPQSIANNAIPCHLHLFHSNRPVRFGIGMSATLENKENARPYAIREDNTDSDQSDSPILYRDDDQSNDRHHTQQPTTKIARKESLSLKLALRPNMDELISRNILHVQSENERQESKEAIGAKLIRRLSMRPTPEELIERNILKSKQTNAVTHTRSKLIKSFNHIQQLNHPPKKRNKKKKRSDIC